MVGRKFRDGEGYATLSQIPLIFLYTEDCTEAIFL